MTEMPTFVGWVWDKIDRGQKGALPNGILYLKGGDLADELSRTGMKWTEYPIPAFFDEAFFETKKVCTPPNKRGFTRRPFRLPGHAGTVKGPADERQARL